MEFAKKYSWLLFGGDEQEAQNYFLTISGGDPMWAEVVADPKVKLTRYRNDHPHLSSALLQHYGITTGALDIIFDPHIALWFATHSYALDSDTCYSHYVPNSTPGVIYLLDVVKAEVINLREHESTPQYGLRGVRQQGGLLLGATEEESDISRYVVKKLIVDYSIYESALIQYPNLSQDYLFPARENDEFYNVLLNEKVSTNLQDVEIIK